MEQTNNSGVSLVENKTKFKLIIPDSVEHTIREWCRLSPNNEWSGTLFYITNGSFENNDIEFTAKDFYVSDIGTSGFTRYKVTPEICNYMMEHDLLDCKTGLIHSHDTMSAFFSGTDSDTLKKEGLDSCHYLSLVVCNNGPYVARVTRHIKEAFEGVKKINYLTYDDTSIVSEDEVSIIERESVEYFNLDIEIEKNYKSLDDEVLTRYNELKSSPTAYKNQSSYPQRTINNTSNYYYNQWLRDDDDDNETFWNKPVVSQPTIFGSPSNDDKEECPSKLILPVNKEEVKEVKEREKEGKEEKKEGKVSQSLDTERLDSIHIMIPDAKEIAAQLLYGNITLSYASFQKFKHVDDWIKKNMEYIFDKRFGKDTEGFKTFQDWMYDYCYTIIYDKANRSLNDLDVDDISQAAYIVASDVKDEIYDMCIDAYGVVEYNENLKTNRYIEYIHECLDEFIYY